MRTLLIYDNHRDIDMEYQNLTSREEHAETQTTGLTDSQTQVYTQHDYNSNMIVRPMSTVSVKSYRSHDTYLAGGRGRGGYRGYGEEEDGWGFLPRTLQKWQIYVCRHLLAIWNIFTDNFKDEPVGYRQSVIFGNLKLIIVCFNIVRQRFSNYGSGPKLGSRCAFNLGRGPFRDPNK